MPSSSEAVEGDSNNVIPFTSAGGNVRYQQVYLDSDLPPGPFTIYGIAFRPDDTQGSFAFEIPDVDIYLGPTEQGTSLSTEFDSTSASLRRSWRPVRSRSRAQRAGPSGGPLAFDIEIWFDQPFAYEGGNLLLDVSVQPYGIERHSALRRGEQSPGSGRPRVLGGRQRRQCRRDDGNRRHPGPRDEVHARAGARWRCARGARGARGAGASATESGGSRSSPSASRSRPTSAAPGR